jgi:hypothetical protein
MPTMIKIPNGDYYVFSRRGKLEMNLTEHPSGARLQKLGDIIFPKEFLGKKVRLKIEFVEEKNGDVK